MQYGVNQTLLKELIDGHYDNIHKLNALLKPSELAQDRAVRMFWRACGPLLTWIQKEPSDAAFLFFWTFLLFVLIAIFSVAVIGTYCADDRPPRTFPELTKEPRHADLTCEVCQENEVNCVLVPCGHMYCSQCQRGFVSCPECRSVPREVNPVWV